MSGDWRRSPILGGVLVVLIIAAGYFVYSKVGGRTKSEDPFAGDAVTLICPHDSEVFKVPYKDLGLDATADPDQVQRKIVDVACPKCGKKECVVPVFCLSCDKPFAAPKTAEQIRECKCPHCGKSPWGR